MGGECIVCGEWIGGNGKWIGGNGKWIGGCVVSG